MKVPSPSRIPVRNFDRTYSGMKHKSPHPPPSTPAGGTCNPEKSHPRRDRDQRSPAVNYQPAPIQHGPNLESYLPPQQSRHSRSQHGPTQNSNQGPSFEREFGPFGTVPEQNVKEDIGDLSSMYRRSGYQPIPCMLQQQLQAQLQQQQKPRSVNCGLTDGVGSISHLPNTATPNMGGSTWPGETAPNKIGNGLIRSQLPSINQPPVVSGGPAASLTNSQRSLRRNEDVDRILNKYGRGSRSNMDTNKDPDFATLAQDVYVTTPDKYCKQSKLPKQGYWSHQGGQAQDLMTPQRRRNVEDASAGNTSPRQVPNDIGGHSVRRSLDEAINYANYPQQQQVQVQQVILGEKQQHSVQNQFSTLPQSPRAAASYTYKPSTHVFPFMEASDGHLLVEPKQIAFESRKLCVLMSDPNNNTTIEFATSRVGSGGQLGGVPSKHERILHEVKRAMSIMDPSEAYGRSNANLFGSRRDINSCYSGSTKSTEEFQNRILLRVNCGRNADTHVMIGEHVFPCHSIALEAFSAYFDRLSRPAENVQKIYLPEGEVSPDAFPVLMDWIVQSEEGRKEIPKKENLVSVYIAAKHLGMKDLEAQCLSFTEKQVDSNDPDLLKIWDTVKNRQAMCPELVRLIASKLAASYRDIYESKRYLQMDVDELAMLLNSDDISIDSEMDVYNSAVSWLLHDWKVRKVHTNKIMSTVRFGLLSPLQLTQISRCPEITQVKGEKDMCQILTYGTVKSMIDDGLSYSILDESYKSQPEELAKWVEKTGMKVPPQRTSLLHKKLRGGPLVLEKIALLEDASQTALRPGGGKPLQTTSSYTLMKEPRPGTPNISSNIEFPEGTSPPSGSKLNMKERSKSRIPMKPSIGSHKIPPQSGVTLVEKGSKRPATFQYPPGSGIIVHELSKPKVLNESPNGSETEIGLIEHEQPSDTFPKGHSAGNDHNPNDIK